MSAAAMNRRGWLFAAAASVAVYAWWHHHSGGPRQGQETYTMPVGRAPTDDEWNALLVDADRRACEKAGHQWDPEQQVCTYAKDRCSGADGDEDEGYSRVWNDSKNQCQIVFTGLRKLCTIDNPTHVPSELDMDNGLFKCKITKDYCNRTDRVWRSDLQDCHRGALDFVATAILGDTATAAVVRASEVPRDFVESNLPGGALIAKTMPSFKTAFEAEEWLQKNLGIDLNGQLIGQTVEDAKEWDTIAMRQVLPDEAVAIYDKLTEYLPPRLAMKAGERIADFAKDAAEDVADFFGF